VVEDEASAATSPDLFHSATIFGRTQSPTTMVASSSQEVLMAKVKSAAVPESVRRRLASLTHRVSWLEAALKPKKDKTPVNRSWANYLRRSAEEKTRDDAMREYREQERVARYREYPSILKKGIAEERKENAFLRSKGLRPKPTYYPKTLIKKVRQS